MKKLLLILAIMIPTIGWSQNKDRSNTISYGAEYANEGYSYSWVFNSDGTGVWYNIDCMPDGDLKLPFEITWERTDPNTIIITRFAGGDKVKQTIKIISPDKINVNIYSDRWEEYNKVK